MKEAEVTSLNTTDTPKRITGYITKVDKEEGYGFIASDEMKFKRFYFFWTYLPNNVDFNSLQVKQKVTFQPMEIENKGWRAWKVELA